jgi:hypothetical protein
VKAYRYGKDLIPFSQDDQIAMKLRSVKCFSIIGFVKMENVNKLYIPQKNSIFILNEWVLMLFFLKKNII